MTPKRLDELFAVGMVAAVGLVAIGVRLMVLGWQLLQDGDDALDVWGDGE